MRKLASIQKILKLEDIPNADQISKATVLGWEVVVKKNEFNVGDLCVYCEIDSILPEKEEFEFLRRSKFRIRTIKLRGQFSQGIIFPLSILKGIGDKIELSEGLDVTDFLEIKKWEPYQEEQKCSRQVSKITYPKYFPNWLIKIIHRYKFIREYFRRGSKNKSFPSLIPKTDETRIQVLQPLLNKYEGIECYITEKLDGSSITMYQINKKFGVCSRNLDLHKDPNDNFWKIAIEHNLEAKFKTLFGNENIAIQGELIGPGIQGNKYKLSKLEVYFFNVFFIRKNTYGNFNDLIEICEKLNVKMVPILDYKYKLCNSIPHLVKLSEGYSKLNLNTKREGIVIRPLIEIEDNLLHCNLVKNRISFKSINPNFLLEYES